LLFLPQPEHTHAYHTVDRFVFKKREFIYLLAGGLLEKQQTHNKITNEVKSRVTMDYRANSRAFVNRSLATTAGLLDAIETDVNEARQIIRSNNVSFQASESVVIMLKEEIKLLKVI
jgi:hypothetical protein